MTTTGPNAPPKQRRGLTIQRYFTRPGEDPASLIAWDRRAARIKNDRGEVIFEQGGVEVPKTWSRIATNVVASRYFTGGLDNSERERSVRQIVRRVTGAIRARGESDGYFDKPSDAETFEAELQHLLLHQMASFNSAVWAHLGLQERPACSACVINTVVDDMDSIMDLAATEAKLFKDGSGSGTNLSPLRASQESLSGGGRASGPVSFMRGYDAFSSVIKGGGAGGPAAKLVLLDVDHPDVLDFVQTKFDEQRKAWALIDAGYEGALEGEAYRSVAFQNASHAVRVTDSFMKAADEGREWITYGRRDANPITTIDASDLFDEIASAVHGCGDPGLHFDSTINDWNTCSVDGQISASSPCSDFMFLGNSACNLATINLMAFVDEANVLDVKGLQQVVDLVVTAQDIIVSLATYANDSIEETTLAYRPLMLGYANLGTLLMARGLPYDSRRGRTLAATVTALITGEAWAQSGRLAEGLGPFKRFRPNREALRRVLHRHVEAFRTLESNSDESDLYQAADAAWQEAMVRARTQGMRNAQVTALAPSATIALVMDCETVGVEPDLALVSVQRGRNGENERVVHRTVSMGLRVLGYESSQIRQIVNHIEEQGTIEGAPGLKSEHLSVFDCAHRAQVGRRLIAPEGHLRMMAALQPFVSGAVSKTLSVPNDTTVEEIRKLFQDAHRFGIKALFVHREGSRRTQPRPSLLPEAASTAGSPRRRRLPPERESITHKFSIAGHKGYVTVGMYEDGRPGELFINMAKAGSVVAGLMDSIALAVSLSLQYGVPLQIMVDKYAHSRFDPSGFTTNPEIPIAKSIVDYIFRWLALKFLDDDQGDPEEDDSDGTGTLFPPT